MKSDDDDDDGNWLFSRLHDDDDDEDDVATLHLLLSRAQCPHLLGTYRNLAGRYCIVRTLVGSFACYCPTTFTQMHLFSFPAAGSILSLESSEPAFVHSEL